MEHSIRRIFVERLSQSREYSIVCRSIKSGRETNYDSGGLYYTGDTHQSLFLENLFKYISDFPRMMDVSLSLSADGLWGERMVYGFTKEGYAVTENGSYACHREIETIKEYTKEELEKIVGHKFKIK